VQPSCPVIIIIIIITAAAATTTTTTTSSDDDDDGNDDNNRSNSNNNNNNIQREITSIRYVSQTRLSIQHYHHERLGREKESKTRLPYLQHQTSPNGRAPF
jgi:hypothetical protein